MHDPGKIEVLRLQNKRCSVRGIGEEQLEFRQGRGTTDGMFAMK